MSMETTEKTTDPLDAERDGRGVTADQAADAEQMSHEEYFAALKRHRPPSPSERTWQ